MRGLVAEQAAQLLVHTLELTTEAFAIVDSQGRFVAVNPPAARLLGRAADELVGQPLQQFSALTPVDFASVWTAMLQGAHTRGSGPLLRSGGEVAEVEYEIHREAAPGLHLLRFGAAPERHAPVPPVMADVRMRAILDHAPMAMFAVDRHGTFTYSDGRGLLDVGIRPGELVGKSAYELFGATPLVEDTGRRITGAQALDEVFAGHTFVGSSELHGGHFDNWFMPVRGAGGQVEGFLGISMVVTRRHLLEQRLRRSERLASVGALAAGVAHELNNPLAYVLGNLEFVTRELEERLGPLPPDARLADVLRALADVKTGAERMAEIVRDLRSLVRDDAGHRVPVSPTRVVESALAIAAHELRYRAQVVREFEPEVPDVLGSEARLGQVFVNLLVNAAHALAEKGQGTVRVVVRRAGPDQVAVEVEDDGPGIPPEHLGRIFDAFFTTKPVGAGTGLGLAISHRIIEEHGGSIDVHTRPGEGTRFTVNLPVAREQAQEVSEGAAAARPVRRRSRVLIVDDDPRVGESLARALDEDCTVTTSAETALAALEHDSRFDLVVCDVMMPGTSGPQLAAQIARRWPALAELTVLVTGGAFRPEVQAELERAPFAKLEKPFDPAVLRRWLDRPALPAL